MNMLRMIKLMACSVILLAATAAQAVPITVNPGAYQGFYFIDGVKYQGVASSDITVGAHQIGVGKPATFSIDIAADGTVTSGNPIAAVGGAGSLTFNNVSVQVDPVAYNGLWAIYYATTTKLKGVQNIVLVPGLSYSVVIARSPQYINISLQADGTVVNNSSSSAVGGLGKLTFLNVPIKIAPGLFDGTWRLIDVYQHLVWEPLPAYPLSVVVVPNQTYQILPAQGPTTIVNIQVDAVGNATSDRPTSITASGNTVTFLTKPVTFDPKQYTGYWELYHGSSTNRTVIGPHTLNLVQDQTYWLFPNRERIPGVTAVNLTLDTAGNVTTDRLTSVTSSGNVVTFKNVTYNIDPVDYTDLYNLGAAGGWANYSGSQQFVGVPDLPYVLRLGGETGTFQRFSLDAAGNVTSLLPSSYIADGTNNTLKFVTMPIMLDTASYTGYMYMNDTYNVPGGPVPLVVVPGLHYRLWVGNGYYAPDFVIDAPCTVTGFPQALIRNADSTTFDVSNWSWSCPMVSVNNPPVADAGLSQNIYLGQTAYLDGSASSDPDGDPIVSYTWTFDSAPAGSVFAAPGTTLTGVSPSFTPDLVGDYMLSLVVNDGTLNSAAATVTITASQNLAPIASAISDVTLGVAPLTVNFDASASYDPEGGLVTYSWSFGDVASGANNIATGVYASHTFNQAGKYTVMLDVTDDFGNVTQASVTIDLGGVPSGASTGGDTGLNLTVHEAKVDYGKEGKVEGKVSLKAGVTFPATIDPTDRIFLSIDGVVLVDTIFSEFKAEDKPGEYEYEGKHLEAKINLTKSTIKVKAHKMELSAIDNSDGVDVDALIGHITGYESVLLQAKHDDAEGKRKLSYKNKKYDN